MIPAAGYYEWTGPEGKKQPLFITVESNQPVMFFAGLYSVLPDGTQTFTIRTREAALKIGVVHHQMPVILETDQIEPWLSGKVSDIEVIDQFGAGWDGRFRVRDVKPFGIGDDGPALLITRDASKNETNLL